ncbi:ATP-binding protein [uncultured Lacinutrix sp.]|uniref:tetratricopeptide repeat-containing hybrid sensor histidine kinase/response regulator n=1 Tax=uncultured Lacinutrix sp. TaxID=574032 RepID=UPI00261AF91B|nr:ATP-binding protein [uncultured Lacinutrix sp.]
MKYVCFCLVAIMSMAIPVFAQQQPNLPSDVMYKEVDRAFELFQRNKYGEAIELSTQVLNHAKSTGDDYLKAKAYNVLGNAYYYIEKDSLSFNYLFKSKDLFVKLKDTSKIIIAYNNIGVNYRVYKDLNKSNTYFKKSLDIAEKSNSKTALVYPLYNIGVNLIEGKEVKPKDYKESLKYLSRAEALAEEHYQKKSIRGEIFEVLSYVHHKLGNNIESLEYYNKTLDFAKKYNYIEIIANAHSTQATINEEKKKFKEAFYALDKYTIAIDSVFSIKQFEMAKQIEADNFLRENKIKLELIEKEKNTQDIHIARSRIYNTILIVFTSVLFFLAFWGFKKNRELKKEKEKAEDLSRVKSDFYSEISHELRTPLYAVIELSNLLLKEDVNIKHKEYLESLQFSGNHLLSLINNVLQLNKVESGTMKVELLDFNLRHIISNIIDSLEFALRDSNNIIHLEYDNSIPKVIVGDSLKLSQVFINLISNAIKFTNNGRITVKTKTVEELEKTVKIYFEVTDTGLGIAKEKQDQVFENFYQEQAKIEKSYKGTGLGLSIVKRVVTAMGSEVKINSEEGKGSTFYFELTFQKSKKDSMPVELYSNQLKEIVGSKILIVDDNKINQLVTKRVLDQLKINSMVVDSGIKAIELVKVEQFDCILMDLNMPELDGYETTKRIREFNKDIAIVALTAATTEEVESKIYNYEINGYVLKPFITANFVNVLNKSMRKTR